MDRPTLSSMIDKYADKLSPNEIVSVYAEELGVYCNELEKKLKAYERAVDIYIDEVDMDSYVNIMDCINKAMNEEFANEKDK